MSIVNIGIIAHRYLHTHNLDVTLTDILKPGTRRKKQKQIIPKCIVPHARGGRARMHKMEVAYIRCKVCMRGPEERLHSAWE